MTKREVIVAAFQQIPLREGCELILEAVVDILCSIDAAGGARMPFTDVGTVRTKKELEGLASAGSDVAKELKGLHEPAILALAAQGYCRGSDKTLDEIRAAAKRAIRTYRKWLPESVEGGRPKNNLAHGVGSALALYYELLTGKAPSRIINPYSDCPKARSPFLGLVEAVFAALAIDANAENIAKAACKSFKAKKKKKIQKHSR